MNLFALTTAPESRVVRFPLTSPLQAELRAVFKEQLEKFMDGVTEIEFDGRYSPDADELLVIRNFVDHDDLAAAVKSPLSVEAIDPKIFPLDSIRAIFTGCPDGSGSVLIQLFEAKRLIATKNLAIFFTGNTFQKLESAGLVLDNKLLAVLTGKELRFQSFHFIRRVFNVQEHFREVTASEVKAFATHEKLASDDPEAFEVAANSVMRRKIGFILQSGVLDNSSVEQIVAAAQHFKLVIRVTPEGKITLPSSPSELRKLLRFLDEDYYEAPLTQTQFVSNSKRVAG